MADNTAQNGTDTIATDDIGGVKFQRVKTCFGADGSATDVAPGAPNPVMPTHTGRTPVHLWATGVAAGSTGAETAISLTKSTSPGGSTSAANSHTPTSGKRFRITSVIFAARGHATATIQATTFALRVNTGGAVTTTSNIYLQARVATPATASAWDRVTLDLGDMGFEMVGDGTLQFGVTANAVFTTNAPTWDVLIVGFEY